MKIKQTNKTLVSESIEYEFTLDVNGKEVFLRYFSSYGDYGGVVENPEWEILKDSDELTEEEEDALNNFISENKLKFK